jgi:alternative ribosome-rescue factor
VTSKLFQVQIVKAKKGKGSYSRQKFKQGQKCEHSALVVFNSQAMCLR